MGDVVGASSAKYPLSKLSFKNEPIPNTTIFLKRTALEFLQILFSTRAEGSFHYDPDDTKTDIQITDSYATALDAINYRPAILVTRGPVAWQGLGLGNGSVESRDMASGDTTFNDLLIGSVMITCLSRNDIEADNVAHLVFNSFRFFNSTLRKRGFFHIRSLNIGAESLVEQEGETAETFFVSISLTAQMQERWTLSLNAARRLEGIIISHLSRT